MKLSLVIPCYNEAKNLPLLIQRCKPLVERRDIEVILVNNGSTDNTLDVLNDALSQNSGFRVVHVEQNQGYGFGVLSGLKAAQGEILGWTHADMQTDPLDALKGLKYFEHSKITKQSIFVKGRRESRPWSDVLFTLGMSVFETILLGKPLWDINAQPTLFSRSFFETWQDPPHDFSLDLYAYYQARLQRLTIHRFPVHFGERAYGVSHWNINWAAKRKFIERTIRFSLELKGWIKS